MKGQISFDILLTAVVLIAVFGTMMTVNGFLEHKQKAETARMQERKIIAGISDMFAGAMLLAETEAGSKISYLAPEIFLPGEGKTGCEIFFLPPDDNITIRANIDGKTVEESRKVIFDSALDYQENDCGSMMTISRAG